MNGKIEFTKFEVNEIRQLISQKLVATKDEQKKIRNKIRNLGFYFSDFSNKKGYTVEDLDNLIKDGIIKITNGNQFENKLIKNKEEENIKKIRLGNWVENSSIEKDLISNNYFSSIKNMNKNILNSVGLYCIRLKKESKLPNRYQSILDQRKHKFIYIGKAEGQTLGKRLKQELEQRGHGTFFRSIGCVLGYLPIKHHLKGKSNQKNFKFSQEDKSKIIKWLEDNIEINIVEYKGDFNIERELIRIYCPLLNDTYNPMKLQELKEDKDKCRNIARN